LIDVSFRELNAQEEIGTGCVEEQRDIDDGLRRRRGGGGCGRPDEGGRG